MALEWISRALFTLRSAPDQAHKVLHSVRASTVLPPTLARPPAPELQSTYPASVIRMSPAQSHSVYMALILREALSASTILLSTGRWSLFPYPNPSLGPCSASAPCLADSNCAATCAPALVRVRYDSGQDFRGHAGRFTP